MSDFIPLSWRMLFDRVPEPTAAALRARYRKDQVQWEALYDDRAQLASRLVLADALAEAVEGWRDCSHAFEGAARCVHAEALWAALAAYRSSQ